MIAEKARLNDIPEIAICLTQMLAETSSLYPQPNDALPAWIERVMGSGIVLVVRKEGQIIATAGLEVAHFPWNNEALVLNENWFFVSRPHRSKGTAVEMIKGIKAASDLAKVPVKFDVMCSTDAEKKDRFFEMQGMEYLGGNFIYGKV